MKREFLTEQGLTKEQIESVMAEYGRDIQAQKDMIAKKDETIGALTTERDGLKQQVADRDKDIKTLQDTVKGNENLTNQLSELKSKYDTDTKALQTRLDEQRADHATERFFAGVEFASTLAKKAAMSDFKAKGYKLKEDGTFEGAEAFFDTLRKEDPAAFKTMQQEQEKDKANEPDANAVVPPRFTGQMSNKTSTPNAASPAANYGFRFVRQPPKQE